MSKFRLLVQIILLTVVAAVQAQDFNVSTEEGHSILSLSAADTLEGNAIISLERDGAKGRAGIIFNKEEASDSISTYPYDPRWFIGTKDDSEFGIFLESKKFDHIDIWGGSPLISIKLEYDDYYERDKYIVQVPSVLKLGLTRLQAYYRTGFKALRLHDGDFIPEDFISSWDLGNAELNEHWDNVVAREFVDYTDLILTTSRSLKSNGYGLNKIMQLAPVKSTNLKSQETKIALDPYEVIKYIPEAVHTYDYDGGEKGTRVKKKVKNYGMKYNQLIPVLIQAIQDQQEMISDMQVEIDALKKE